MTRSTSTARRRAKALPLALTGMIVAPGLALLPAGVASAAVTSGCLASGTTTTCTFLYTGEAQTFTVPNGVTSLDVIAVGARGGNGGGLAAGKTNYGQGASIEDAALTVLPGSSLNVVVGGVGADGSAPANQSASGGSPGGGGASGASFSAPTQLSGAGGGGGYSGVFDSTSNTPFVVAGGGGGGAGLVLSGHGGNADTGNGADAGGTPGPDNNGNPGAGGGGGGTSGTLGLDGAGGAGGHSTGSAQSGTAGSSLQGGKGGDAFDTNNLSGGGGGGGYYGGGGGGAPGSGYAGGGGGGSSYVRLGDTLSNGQLASGPAEVIVSYASAAATGIAATGGDGQSTQVDTTFPKPLTATVTADSTTGGSQPAPYEPVTFTIKSGPATFPNGATTATVVTGQDGTATSPELIAGDTPGDIEVDATTPDVSSAAVFTEHVLGIAPTLSGTPPKAGVGEPYSYQFTVTGNPTPTVGHTGTLPPGLSLSESGLLSGIPSKAGSYSFTVTATNGTDPNASLPVTLVVQTRPVLRINDRSVVEGNRGVTNARFTVGIGRTSTVPVTVHWTTADGTAKAGSDYVAGSGVVTIPVGSRTATIVVPVKGDTVAEPDETYDVLLTQPTGATIADGVGIGGIVNDD